MYKLTDITNLSKRQPCLPLKYPFDHMRHFFIIHSLDILLIGGCHSESRSISVILQFVAIPTT